MKVHKWSWGIAWVLFGAAALGVELPYLPEIMGVAFIIAGIAYIMEK